MSDSTKLCLSPPFPSQWRRFTLPPYDIKSGVDDLEPVQRVRIHRDPRPSVDVKLFIGANASEEIESSAPQGRWGEFTLTLGFGRGNIEEKSGERLGYRECPSLNPCNSTVTLLSLH